MFWVAFLLLSLGLFWPSPPRQTADRNNGNNGEIGLPYFDWYALATTGGDGASNDPVNLNKADGTVEVDLLPRWFTEASAAMNVAL